MAERLPVLFDTDIGSDIDDAAALAYLLCEPRCELLGVTTVSGEPEARARLASALCRAAERADVPVFAGAGRPLLGPQRQPAASQSSVLARWGHQERFAAGAAVPFLRETIRARPGAVTLLAVGPLTNVAALFAADPELPALLRELVWMGGAYLPGGTGSPRVEWNAGCDPHAAALALRLPGAPCRLFGLDVTLQCRLEAAECRQRFRGGVLDVVAEMAEVWFGERRHITFHDPLAAAAVFDAGVCGYERGTVEVELASVRVPGMTHWRAEAKGPHRVAASVEPERFFERYFGVFGQGPG